MKNIIVFSIIILTGKLFLLFGTANVDPYFKGLLTISIFLLIYYFALRSIKKAEGKLTLKMSFIYIISILLLTGLVYLIFYLFYFIKSLSLSILSSEIIAEFYFIIGSLIISFLLTLLMKLRKRYIVSIIILIYIALSFVVFSIMMTIEAKKQREMNKIQQMELERYQKEVDKLKNDTIDNK